MFGIVDNSVVYKANKMHCVDIGFNILMNTEPKPNAISTVRMVPTRRARNDRISAGEFPGAVCMGSKVNVLSYKHRLTAQKNEITDISTGAAETILVKALDYQVARDAEMTLFNGVSFSLRKQLDSRS